MFIRKKKHKDPKTGTEYHSYQLIESVRTERGPRQRILLNLGSNLTITDADSKLLANRIEEIISGIQPLMSYPEHVEHLAKTYARKLIRRKADLPAYEKSSATNAEPKYHSVDLDSLEHDHCRTAGIESIAYETLKQLRLDELLRNIGFSSRQVEIATSVIIGRLVYPSSERGTHHWLKHQTGLDELMDTDFSRLSLNNLYKAGDHLIKHKHLIETHLESTENELFSLEDTIILYDLTNTYFEGRAQAISLAHRGHSKENRSDAPLVTLALVLGESGFPKRSRIFSGNISEPSTLKTALEQLEFKGNKHPVVVLDGGIATEHNLEYLRNNGYSYIVASRSKSCELPTGIEMELVKEKKDNVVHAALVHETASNETHLYCHSTAREEKETSMRSLLQERFEADLTKVANALKKKGGIKSYSKVLQRVGRLKEKHKRVAHYYDIDIKADEDRLHAISITWKFDKKRLDHRFQGTYLLRAYGLDWDADRLWKTYIMLTDVEEGFRCLKTDLGLRPVFHKIDRRVGGHLFITVLAYHIMQTILYQLRLAGLNIRWITVRRIMSSQVRVTSTMRLQDGRQVHIRSTANAEPEQKEIYQILKLPNRPGHTIKTFV